MPVIRNVQANGFRSLENFEIELRPGLNVLVGPNGGGKTNILALLSFISRLATTELGEAINESGGASKVFKKLAEASFAKEISISVRGIIPYDLRYYFSPTYRRILSENRFTDMTYLWSFTIDASKGYDEAFYSFQKLQIRIGTDSLFARDSDDWDAELTAFSPDGRQYDTTEKIIENEYSQMLFEDKRESLGFNNNKESLELGVYPIHVFLYNSPLIRSIGFDLRSGTTFNFDPSVCKQTNDSAQSPVLDTNGNGLAATIYAIQKGQGSAPTIGPFYRHKRDFSPHIYKSLVSYFQLINENVCGVRARNDPINNKITALIEIEGKNTPVSFPVEFSSDGTVKWLAFVTALLTEKSGFAIEEPENFLHPEIQRQAVDLVRAETEGAENLFVLLTTHSETLLNATRPEEVVIVSMRDGITWSKRLDHAADIDEEINATGFGLGYFYISGALND